MIEKPDIDAVMAGGLSDWLDGKAELRKDTDNIAFMQMAAGIIAAAVIGGLALGLNWGTLGFMAAFIVGGWGIAWAARTRKKVTDQLKEEMNGALASSLGIAFSKEVPPNEEFQVAHSYGLLAGYDKKVLEDCWYGDLAGTTFRLYEAKLTERRGSGKNRRDVTTFEGVIMRFHFARDFHGTTLVQRNAILRFSLFGETKKISGQKLERIKMTDSKFEDAFDVFGTDPVEAHYLVHPAYCERLVEVEREFGGKKLKALFHGGDVILTMHLSDNLFESGSLDPTKDRELLADTVEQFASLAKLVKVLNERAR